MNRLGRAAGAAALLTAVMCAGAIPSAVAACPNENASPAQLTTPELSESVGCLINEERAASGLGSLAVNGSLQQAALKHSKAMNRRNFIGHGDVKGRARRAGYGRGRVGEVIGWGSTSPRWIVNAWMRSQIHRATMLMPGFTVMGVGVDRGSPLDSKRRRGWAIYTVDFGNSAQ